jgi:hypothetical protein
MPTIPVNSALGYIGVFLMVIGFFLILAGLDIFKVEKISVKSGRRTWGFGVFLAVLGIAFLLPDILKVFQETGKPIATDVREKRDRASRETNQQVSSAYANVYIHQFGLLPSDAKSLKYTLEKNGIATQVFTHTDPGLPDAIFIGALVGAKEANVAISAVPYEIKYIFRPDYPVIEGGDPAGLLIGIGYISSFNSDTRSPLSEPVAVSKQDLDYLTQPGLSNLEFQQRLRNLLKF